MSSKQKGQGPNKAGTKEKIVPVAEGSLQSRSPGAGPGKLEDRDAGLLHGSRQSENMQSQGGQYGGAGSQQSGWSARQQAQRMQARAEEQRRGESQQSGYGGLEQYQHAGAQESRQAEPQAGASGAHNRKPGLDEPASDFTSKPHAPDKPSRR
ncbi:hypothetical protein NX774_21525 [Massilia agilis]|uniref:Uncharacterized protein n=1 Tax=Massilia agilis TaxID=1811226 RepID=A0ABT2DH07_9BURK|nr:hypothetical protein [Massilia agilis]MCS0810509.1 hypothetical protein [Massilia agilis]